jgi:hypothetical protein
MQPALGKQERRRETTPARLTVRHIFTLCVKQYYRSAYLVQRYFDRPGQSIMDELGRKRRHRIQLPGLICQRGSKLACHSANT